MAVSSFKHGTTWRDVPTSIRAPITADSGIPVAVGAAPIHLADSPAALNVPRIYYSYEDAVAEMGFSYDFKSFGLCEVMYAYFVLFNAGPVILINVFDPADHLLTPAVADESTPMSKGVAVIDKQNIVLSSVEVSLTTGGAALSKDTDYSAAYTQDGTVKITRIPSGTIPVGATAVFCGYSQCDPSAITDSDIIGGIDVDTDKGTGLEAIEDVFPIHSIVPGILLAPGYSQVPEVAAVMASKSENINGCFKCVAYVDIDSTTVIKAQDVNDWKQDNSYVSNRLIDCWPRVAIDEKQMWLSTQYAALTLWVDHKNADVPVESPSNKGLKMNKSVAGPLDTPVDLFFSKASADSLNGQGICTAINWIGGWKAWGNRTSVYPSESDVKDMWIPVRRMTDYVGNTLVLTVFQFVDRPGNRRLIQSIIDSVNIWLNSLVASGNCLGARVEFLESENSTTELLNGHYRFHLFAAYPIPAEWIEWLLEFDVNYLSVLFTPVSTQTPPAT